MKEEKLLDCHKKLYSFFDEKVRLREKHATLREYRDKNLERLTEGTKKLADKGETVYIRVNDCSQGSMAMHTINQAQNDDDHDIDHAIIYDEKDIQSDPQEARDFVAKALKEAGGNFKVEPEAKTNAVTITYQDGYHVDFAIYKRVTRGSEVFDYFHAGETWTRRDPLAITDWFNDANSTLSPKNNNGGVTVADGQLKRIVRLFKFWSKSRSDWSLPGGLVLSTLVVNNYVSNKERDDVAFYETIKKISDSLIYSRNVPNPVDHSLSLTTTEKHKNQMDSLVEKLADGLNQLSFLFDGNCNEEKGIGCWSDFFDTSYWKESRLSKSETGVVPLGKLNFKIMITTKTMWGPSRFEYKPLSKGTIPKKASVRFEILNDLPSNAKISWEVQNRGDEAKWHKQIAPRSGGVDQSNPKICNETTSYRGNHTMKCMVEYDQVKIVEHIPVRIR